MQALILLCFFIPLIVAKFELYQNISTNGGNDAEFFEIEGNRYLAWANANGNNTKIYQWSNSGRLWTPYAVLDSLNCQGVTFFTINSFQGPKQFLVLSSFGSPSSPILIWDSKSASFQPYQELPITLLRKFKFTPLQDTFLLAAAQQVDFVKVFQYNAETALFELIQNISMSNAQDLSFLTIGTETFLSVANGDFNASLVYIWKETAFEIFQTLEGVTQGQDTYGYYLDGQPILAVPTYSNSTFLFRWSGLDFRPFLTINGAYQYNAAIPFYVGDVQFLGIAADGPPPSYEAPSAIYFWNGNQYIYYQSFPSFLAQTLASFEIDGTTYLVIANLISDNNWVLNSQIFYWVAD